MPGKLRDDIKELCKNTTLILLISLMTIRLAVGFARGFFEPLAFYALYPDQFFIYTIMNAVFLVLCPIPGYLVSGRLTDRWERKQTWIRPLIVAISMIWTAVLYPIMLLGDSFFLSCSMLCIQYLIGEIYMPLSLTMIMNVTSPQVRALQTGLTFCLSMIGSSLVSVWLGYEKFANGNEDFMSILLWIVTGGCVIWSIMYFILCFVYPRDLVRDSDEKSIPLLEKNK